MIVGRVSNREAVVRLTLGPDGAAATAEAVIDTGYTDFLTLPADLFQRLAEGAISQGELEYADKRIGTHDLATVTVEWDRTRKRVTAAKLEGVPLIGMSLLDGYRLIVDAIEGGRVIIEPIPGDALAPIT